MMNKGRLAARILRPGSDMTEEAELTHAGSTTTIQIVTSPLSGDERLALGEGLRSVEETRQFITRAAVASVNLDSGHRCRCTLLYNGQRYRAVQIKNWGEGFFEVIGQRVET